eukprot:8879096-Alexandrium_andersonii.AAC.1
MDLGSDGFSGANAAIRKLRLNLEICPGPSHMVWNAVKGALRHCQLWVFMLTSMLAHSVPHGPFADDLRLRQAQAAMD